MRSFRPLSALLVLAALGLPAAAGAEKMPPKPGTKEAAPAVTPPPQEASPPPGTPEMTPRLKEMQVKQFDWKRISLAEGYGLAEDSDGRVRDYPEYRMIGDIVYLRGKAKRIATQGKQLVGQVGEDARPRGGRHYSFVQPCACPLKQLSVSMNLYGQLHVGATYRASGEDDIRIGDWIVLDGIFYFVK